jgi:sugar phosphate isomerase/epimerase
MKKQAIAVQLHSVRDYCNDARQIVETIAKIRSVGFKAVELRSVGPLPPHELARVLENEGLICSSTHEDAEELLTEPEAVLDRLAVLGCANAVYPKPKNQDLSTLEGVRRLCKALNRTGRIMRKAGVTFAYHHHAAEFHMVNGKTALEWILAETDPLAVQVQLDTYWVQAGGGDPAEWLIRLKGRASLLHLKDFGVDAKGNAVFEELGQGNLSWARILPAARRAGCEWYIVEQDSDWENGDPFLSLKMSLAYLKRALAA